MNEDTDDDYDGGNSDDDDDGDHDDDGRVCSYTKALDTKALTAQTLKEKGRNIGKALKEMQCDDDEQEDNASSHKFEPFSAYICMYIQFPGLQMHHSPYMRLMLCIAPWIQLLHTKCPKNNNKTKTVTTTKSICPPFTLCFAQLNIECPSHHCWLRPFSSENCKKHSTAAIKI